MYVTAPSIQQYFVDKDTGLPLSGGYIYFYHDNNRTVPKTVYTLSGNEANYTYTELPNPLVLSSAGIPVDASGNPIVIYWYPYDVLGNVDLYYIRVVSSTNVPQQTVQAWPSSVIGSGGGGGFDDSSFSNYIPNGQFLAHTNPPNSELVAGYNIIAQGGFYVNLPDDVTSDNTLNFSVEGYNPNIAQSPRYLCNFTCNSPNPAEAFKKFGVRWRDVNKFSEEDTTLVEPKYTFAFYAGSNVTIPINIQIYRNFGTDGSVTDPINIASAVISTSGMFINVSFNFPSNAGYNVDTVNNDDFIAIEILFPTSIPFQCVLTDFIMSQTVTTYDSFPIQTNADMLSRGVAGWMETPDGNGMDLYLPPILTKEGMIFDTSQIGTAGMSYIPIDSPTSTNPIPQHNMMPADGQTYLFSDYASNGIPFRRLGNVLTNFVERTYNRTIPLFGTGDNYITAIYPFSDVDTNLGRISYNSPGTGSILAADGMNTNIVFEPMYIYDGSTTGTADLGFFASNCGIADSIIFNLKSGNAINQPDAGTSGFTVQLIDGLTDYFSFQGHNCASLVTCVPGAALAGGVGKFVSVSNTTDDYYIWFNVDGGNTDPMQPGRIGIQVNIQNNYTAQDVADALREALLGLNSTSFVTPDVDPGMPGGIQPGSWFTFSANPSALRNFYAWFSVDGSGTEPTIPGAIGIEVDLASTDNSNETRDKIIIKLNTYQFAAPLSDGLFFRAADPNGIWDADNIYRTSGVPGIGGANAGTFEYSQFLSHFHIQDNPTLYAGPYGSALNGGNTAGQNVNRNTEASGGSETRPVNTYVYPFIRY